MKPKSVLWTMSIVLLVAVVALFFYMRLRPLP
jgi:hypothetical protein